MVFRAAPAIEHPMADASSGAGRGPLQVDYLALLLGSPDAVLLLDLDSGRFRDANASAEAMLGRPLDQLRQCGFTQLCPELQPDGRPSADQVCGMLADVAAGHRKTAELRLLHADGHALDTELRFVMLPIESQRLLHVRLLDLTQGKRSEHLRAGEARLLEMVARGHDLRATFDSLLHLIEELAPGVLCSILLLDEDGVHVHPAAGPSLPPAYMNALEGAAIGPSAGSCGTAMYRNETVIVSDIEHDPLWADYKGLALAYDLRACWSTPIAVDHGKVLGSFAMYYKDVRKPGEEEFRLIEVATHLSGIAIERTRRERELARHREHLQELVDERTAALTQANAELAQANDNLRSAQAELVRRDKLAALGTLVAGMSHELNTPIGNSLVTATTLQSETEALQAALAGGIKRSALESYLEAAGSASGLLTRNLQRAAELVATFKQLAVEQDSGARCHFSLSRLLADVLQTLTQRASKRGLVLQTRIGADIDMNSFPGPLVQVISHIIDNCLEHAFADGAQGSIQVTATSEGDDITILVSDDGAGIAPELQAQVFDPFFTTRLGSGKLGLGLHLVYNIVTGVLGGSLALTSAPGEGTTLRLRLPRTAPIH